MWHQLRSSRSLWRQSWAAVSHQRCSSGILRLWTQAVTPQRGPKQSLPNRRPPRLKDLGMSFAASQQQQPVSTGLQSPEASRLIQHSRSSPGLLLVARSSHCHWESRWWDLLHWSRCRRLRCTSPAPTTSPSQARAHRWPCHRRT